MAKKKAVRKRAPGGGRKPKPGGRGDGEAVPVNVRLTREEAALLDGFRGGRSRAEHLRLFGVNPER